MIFKKFYNYDVYEDGKIFSHYRDRFLKPDLTKLGYLQVSLTIDKKLVRYKVHRLVALLFLEENIENKPTVNHKDGDKLNNHYSNLEWATFKENNQHAIDNNLRNVAESNRKRWEDDDFRKRVSNKISKTQQEKGINKGQRNPRFKYIINYNNVVIERTDLSKILNMSQSNTDRIIKDAANGKIHKKLKELNIIISEKEGQSTIEKTLIN